MNSKQSPYSHIWQPIQIGNVEVKNRILMTAMTSNYAEDYIISDRHIAFYRERARGGAALMITEQQGAYPYTKGSFQAKPSWSGVCARSVDSRGCTVGLQRKPYRHADRTLQRRVLRRRPK